MTHTPIPLGWHTSRFHKVVVLGAGDVVNARVRPALLELRESHGIGRIAYFDLSARAFDGPPLVPGVESFHQLPAAGSAVALAGELGLLGPDALVLVCTPTASHVAYLTEFAPHAGRLAGEKPLCHDPAEAAPLFAFDGRLFPLGHQLFKAPMLALTAECRRGGLTPEAVGHLRFTLFESKGVGRRQVDPAVFDLVWHGFECALAPVAALTGETPALEIVAVREGTYHGGPDDPRVSTAARVEARLVTSGGEIPLLVRVGKGMAEDRKALEVFGPDGNLVRSAPLTEGGHHAHRRMIAELLTAEEPDMQLNLRQVVGVVEACAEATRLVGYRYGAAPDWLTADLEPALCAPAA